MIGEWIEIREIFKLLDSSQERTIGHSTIFVVAKPDDHLYYLESFTQIICTEYPCRYVLLKEEPTSTTEFLKAKLNFLETARGSGRFCEFIEIEFTPGQKERLATSLSKFTIPKLDVFLVLWQRELEHKPIFDALKNIATRIIFDSEYALDPNTVLDLMELVPPRSTIGDLSYTRAYSIREILVKELTTPQLAPLAATFHTLKIQHNPCFARCTDIPIQSLYLGEWLAMWAKMTPIFKTKIGPITKIIYDYASIIIEQGEAVKELGEGKILQLELIADESTFLLQRDTNHPDRIFTAINGKDSCSMPASFSTEDLNIGQSLMRQLQYDQTNQLQLEALRQICHAPYKKLLKYPSVTEAMQHVKERILFLARQAIQMRGVFRIALSGGTTPMALYRSFQPDELDWSKVQFFFSDERQVPPESVDSNYKNATEALAHLHLDPNNIHRMVGEKEPDSNAYAYERLILPYLDLSLFGMGIDGHTLSLFPGSKALEVTDRLVVAASGPNHERLTFTLKALDIIKTKIFLVFGEEKKETLSKVFSEKTPDHPASLVLNADFYTDLDI